MRRLQRLRHARARPLEDEFDAIVAGQPTGDRNQFFGRLRREAPLIQSRALGAWVVSSYEDVRSVLQNPSLVHVTRGPGMTVLQGGFQAWRGAEHSKKMGIVGRRLRSARALREGMEPKVAVIASELAENLPLGAAVDLKQEFTNRMPLLVFCALAGLEDPLSLSRWFDENIANVAPRQYEEVVLAGVSAVRQLSQLIAPVVAERRARPGPDLISDLVSGTYDGVPLPDDEVALILAQLYTGTHEAERLITCAFRHLAVHAELSESMRKSLEDDRLLTSFGAEALRMFSPIQAVTRVAAAETTLAGRDFRAGEVIVALLTSANRDEQRFTDPERFDQDRFLENPERQYTAAGDILPFGAGEHFCVGSRVAQLMVVHAVRQLLRRADRLALAAPAPDIGGLMTWAPAALPVILT